jgi:hypothetical protein
MRKMWKLLLRKRGVTPVISSVILTGAVIAVSFVVLSWTQYRSSAYNEQYGDAMDADIAQLKERLTFEHIFYNGTEDNLSVYLMNCGTIDNVTIQTVYIKNNAGASVQAYSSVTLMHFNGTEIANQDLDRTEEGYFVLSSLADLVADSSYTVRVVTGRGSTFDYAFVA